MTWLWLNTPWACGGVACDAAGVVRECAPIFRRTCMGRPLNAVIRRWRRVGQRVEWARVGGAA